MEGDPGSAASVVEAATVPMSAAQFEAWVAPYWSGMAHFAARLVGSRHSEDVLQEALATAWHKRARFDERRGSARSWLLALVADQARRSRRRIERERPQAELDTGHVDPDLARRVDVDRAISRLTRRQRLAVDLYYYLDLPVVEVAAVMGCSVGTAKSTLTDARARLRRLLEDNPDD